MNRTRRMILLLLFVVQAGALVFPTFEYMTWCVKGGHHRLAAVLAPVIGRAADDGAGAQVVLDAIDAAMGVAAPPMARMHRASLIALALVPAMAITVFARRPASKTVPGPQDDSLR